MSVTLAVAFYGAAEDNEPLSREVTWEELSAELTKHAVRTEKNGLAWSPALMKPCPPHCWNAGKSDTRDCGGGQAHRLEQNVASLSCAVIDVDHLPEDVAEAALGPLIASGYAAAVHSTFSHAPPADCCLRVVLPLLRPVTAPEWLSLRPALIAHFGIPELRVEKKAQGADKATRDPSRLFYTPAHPPGATPFALLLEGAFLDPDKFTRTPPREVPTVETPGASCSGSTVSAPLATPVDIGSLRALVRRRFNKAKATLDPVISAGLQKALDEVAIAEHGERNDTVHKVMGWLAFAVPEASDDALLELVRVSVEALDGKTDMSTAEKSLRRAREDKAKKDDELKALKGLETLRLMERAGFDGAYTDEQVEAWALAQGIGRDAFRHRWMLNTPLGIFFNVRGEYIGPVRQDRELTNAIQQYLAPAETDAPWGVQFIVPTANGEGMKAVSRDDLLRRYAVHLRNVEYSFVRQTPELDFATSTLRMPIRPLRPWKPVEHPEVQHWLELIGGEKHSAKVLDWIATVTQLQRMTCALYIEAPKNLGKNLLANGLAKLWTEGMPAKFEDLVSDFQDSLMHCPLVHADEALPAGRQSTIVLRQLVSNPYTYVNQKFGAKTRVEGAIRLLMTGNNSSMLRTTESLTEDDVSATASRILHVRASDAPGEYRRSLGPEPEIAWKWCEGGAIAEHALWLAQTRKVRDTGRFLVEGETSEASHALALNSEHVEAVCEILVKHLLSPAAEARAICDACILAGSGELVVATAAFSEADVWKAYAPTHRQLTPTAVGLALKLVSHGKDSFAVSLRGKQIRVRRMRLEYLRAWIEQSGIGTPESFDEVVNKPSEAVDAIKARNTLRFQGKP